MAFAGGRGRRAAGRRSARAKEGGSPTPRSRAVVGGRLNVIVSIITEALATSVARLSEEPNVTARSHSVRRTRARRRRLPPPWSTVGGSARGSTATTAIATATATATATAGGGAMTRAAASDTGAGRAGGRIRATAVDATAAATGATAAATGATAAATARGLAATPSR
eukprot:30860-Pelagococcus_subviridis.AAC.11